MQIRGEMMWRIESKREYIEEEKTCDRDRGY